MMTFWGPAMPPPPRGAFHDVNVLLPSWRLTTEPATGQGTPHVARSAWTQVGGRPVGPLRFAQGPTPRMTHLRSNLRHITTREQPALNRLTGHKRPRY